MEYVPRFDELPEEMDKLDWASEVEFVKVNMAGNEAAVREKYGVRGYPWIQFYKEGKGRVVKLRIRAYPGKLKKWKFPYNFKILIFC